MRLKNEKIETERTQSKDYIILVDEEGIVVYKTQILFQEKKEFPITMNTSTLRRLVREVEMQAAPFPDNPRRLTVAVHRDIIKTQHIIEEWEL